MRFPTIKESDDKEKAFNFAMLNATHELFAACFPKGTSNLSDSDLASYDKLYNSISDVVIEWQKWVDEFNNEGEEKCQDQ